MNIFYVKNQKIELKKLGTHLGNFRTNLVQ
jgi:hypothetical protein